MDTRQEYGRCLDHSSTNRLLRTAAGLHPTAAGVLLTSPTSFLHETAAHHAQSAGATNGGLLRTGLPELSRPGPPHASPAGSVSTPSPIPQCQERYYSSLSINTGSTYGFLHGDRGMTGAIPSASASLPFRTPPGLSASVRHHWSHTPSPLDSYGRYGIGPSLYSLFPMVTSAADANTYCMQSAAARLFHKANPYHQFLDASRELGLYHHHHHHHGGMPLGSPYSPTLTLDPSDLAASSSSLDIERAGTPMDFMCKNFTGYRDCPSSLLIGKHPGVGVLSNSSGTGVEFGGNEANSCGVGNIDVGKTSTVRSGRSSDGRRSKSSKESAQHEEKSRTLSTSPGRCSSHPRNSGVKTAFSPPTGTAATFAPSKKGSGNVATLFKADKAPPSTSAVENIQRSANVQSEKQKVLMEEQRHGEKTSNRDPVKEEFHYKSGICRREKCNSGNGTRYCSESMSTVAAARPLSQDLVADQFVQVQALNLSQNSGGGGGDSQSALSGGTAKDEYHIIKERNTCARANTSEKDNGQTSSDRVKDVALSLKCSEVPTDKVSVCDKSGIRIKQEGKKELVYTECQFGTDSSGVVTNTCGTGVTPVASKMETSWSTSSSKGGLRVTGGAVVKESRRPGSLSSHGKDFKKHGSTKSIEAIVSSIVSSKNNVSTASSDTNAVATHSEVVSGSSCCDTFTKVTTTLATKDSSTPKNGQSELPPIGDALHLLRACRDVEVNVPNKAVSSHPDLLPLDISMSRRDDCFSTVRSPHRSSNQNNAEKGLDLTKDFKCLTSVRNVQSRHTDSDVKPENLSIDMSVKSVIVKAPQATSKDCGLTNSGPSMSPFHCQPGPHQWPWHGTSDVCVTKNVSDSVSGRSVHRLEPKPFLELKSPTTTHANNTSSVSFHGTHQHSLKTVQPFSHPYIWQQQQHQQPMQGPYDLSINSSVSSSSSAHCSTTIATSCSIDSSVTTCQSTLASPVSSSVTTSQKATPSSNSETSVESGKVPSEEEESNTFKENGGSELCNKLVDETSEVSPKKKKKNLDMSSPSASARLSAIAELNQQGKASKLSKPVESDSVIFSHSTTGTTSIPVGIAVARQRQECHKSNLKQKNSKEHRKQSSSEHSHSQNANHNNRNEDFLREQKELACRNEKPSNGHTIPSSNLETNLLVTSGGPASPSCWEDGGSKAGTSIQARWMPATTHGRGVSPQALWLGQRSYAAAPASMPMQIGSLEHSSRQFPPLGYQLARDPIPNLFLIPTTNIDLVDRPLVWPSFTTATLATTTPPQLPPHHGSFQQYILQQQQQQLLQQEQQRTLEFRLQHESQQEMNKNVAISQLVTTNIERNVGLDLSQNGNLLCPSIKEETVRCEELQVKPTTILSSSTPSPIITSIPVPGRTFPYVFSASANPMPYYYDHAASATVVHVASAPTEEANILLDSEKRSQGTSPVPCPDSCLTPDSDIGCPRPLQDDGDLSDSEKMLLEQEEVDVLGDSNDSMKLEPLMADACNQTETPPMTDDEEELDDEEDDDEDDDEEENDDSQSDQKRIEDGTLSKGGGLIVKQEDSSIQCELLSVKSCDLSSCSSLCEAFLTDRKTSSASDVVNGLELLSNTIQEHEKSHGSSKVDETHSQSTYHQADVVRSDSDTIIPLESSTEKLATVNGTTNCADVSSEKLSLEPEEVSNSEKTSSSTSLGGLGLLCALAEQRILQETHDGSEVENGSDTLKRLDVASDSDINRNYKILKNQKEYKDFIAHKMQQYSSLGAKLTQNESGGMDAAEFEMRVRLAELQKKYKEKQRELARLLPKKGKEDFEKGSSKRGPGRPRKRKLFSLYKSKTSKHHKDSDDKASRSRREQSVFGFSATSSKKSQEYSLLKGSMRIGKQILKPAVLKPQKSSSDPSTWLSSATPLLTKSDVPAKTFGGPVPFQSGFANITMTSSFGKTTPIKTATLLATSLSLSYKMSPTESSEITTVKDVVATPDESSSEPSDSDDSYSCSQRKRKNKRMVKDLVLKHTKRKETSKSCGRSVDTKKFGRWGEDDDSVDLSVSFSSLSVSCTMPPFQGCEESTGLGLLAKYASEVVEQTESSKATQQAHSEGEWLSDQEGATTSASTVLESRKRKPGRPKKHSPIKTDEATETIVAKKPKTLNFIKLDPTTCMTSSKLPTKSSSKGSDTNQNNSEAKYSFLEDEAWLRRRSERIFLNEPRINPHSSFSLETTQMHKKPSTSFNVLDDTPSFSSLKSKPEQQTKPEQVKPKKKHMKIKSESELNAKKPKVVSKQGKEKDNSELKLETESCIPVVDSTPSVVETHQEVEQPPSTAAAEESDSDSPENSSFSEGDNLPLSKLIERPTTPEPRSCVIKAEELRDSLRVLTMMDGLFYAGYINAIRAPDVYGITVDGERGNRPHIYSREEVLQEAIYEVKPCSIRYLSEGTRVCAFWSQQYRCLYPGTVTGPSSPNSSPDNNSVNVEFDDGDSGRIEIDNVRLLPPDLPIISYEPDPLVAGKRRTKSTGDLSREKRPPLVPLASQSKKLSSLKSSKLKPVTSKSTSNNEGSKLENSSDVWNNGFPTLLPSTEIKSTSTLTVISSPLPKNTYSSWEMNKSKIEDSTKSMIIMSKQPTRLSPICPSSVTTLAEVIASSTAVTTITSKSIPPASITVIAIGSGSTLTSRTEVATLKSKKHKKHRDREKTDDRRHHHHHHHHHKHRRKHDKREEDKKVVALIESMTKPAQMTITNTNVSVTKEKVSKPAANGSDSKKPELTLKIKTNSSAETSRLETNDKKNGVGASVGKKRTLSVDTLSSQSDDHEVSSQCSSNSSDEVSSEKSDNKPLPPPSKKAKVTKEDSGSTQKNLPKAKKGKEKGSNVESKSKMAAFLPARQLWKWAGKSFKSPGKKGKAKKEFYKSITRGKETIRVGDSAVFLSTGRPHLPYIGRIEMMWESWGGNMVVKVKWFYHPEETKGGRRLADTKGALYQSLHVDENDVQTISHKCEVLSWDEYSKQKKEDGNQQSKYGSTLYNNSDLYYLAGTYDPMTGVVTLEPGVS